MHCWVEMFGKDAYMNEVALATFSNFDSGHIRHQNHNRNVFIMDLC